MITVEVKQVFELNERQARKVVREWATAWVAQAPVDPRAGFQDVANAARELLTTLAMFERANSGDNGK